jgi:predicted acyl esterase
MRRTPGLGIRECDAPVTASRAAAIGFLVLLISISCLAQTKHVVSVPASDGILLDATYYVPLTSPPHTGFPAIIFIHGFAMSKAETDASAQVYARMGYLTFTYSVRGHGDSQGLSTIMSWKERNDLRTVVTYVGRLPGVDAGSIGITGGSQGGLHGLWAAADDLPVAAITADVIGPHWASDMLANGCYRTTLAYLLSANTVRFDAVRDTLYNLLINDDYDGLYNTFVPPRDIDGRAFELSRTPLMMFGKWQDHYFRANEGINAYDVYHAMKNAEKLYIGTGGHYSDDVPSEWNYQFGWITSWFDQFLLGNNNGILRQPDITYAFSSLPMDTNGYFTWTRRALPGWPPAGITPFKFYLSANGSLSPNPVSASNASRMLLNDFRDSTYSIYWAYWDDFQGDWFDSSFHRQALVFQTPPLTGNVDWLGVPTMHLYVSSDADRFPINAQVYEVDPAGNKYFVNRINYEGRGNQPGSLRVIDADGNAHAHRFMAGNSIRIELTNIDQTNRKLLGYYPFVVPVFKRSQTSVLMDATHPSYIELPILAGIPLGVPTAGDKSTPEAFTLAQNYPNPFNPTTTIQYALAQRAKVVIDIHDVLGREVERLVDQVQEPGEKSIRWDASGVSGGVYFYRLTAMSSSDPARTFTSEKKMVLIK